MPYRDIQSCRPINKTMSQTHEPDLTAMEGPDDWVSLFLDGANDDMLNDLEMSDFSVTPSTPAGNGNNDKIASVEKSGRISAPELEQAVSSLNTEDMCLPSLDDLLADYPATVPDDGLFSGFQSLDNQGLDVLALPDKSATQSHQHSNNMSGRTSEDHSYSAGSEGELSTAAAQLDSVESTPGFPSQQAQHRTPVQPSNRVIPAPTTAGSMPSAAPPLTAGQGASPSLVGMTVAQVAEALGYTSQPAYAQQAQGLSNLSKQPAVRRQATGKKKRGRETETPHPVAAVRDASVQQAVSSQAAEVASRAGSPGVSSSNDASQADLPHEHSSGQGAAGDDEEQKRMARMQRNRESAHQSRQRKRMQMDEVEQRCEQLKQQNSQLNQLVGRLTSENMGLKQQLVNVCHETGRPLPPPPLSAMHPFAFGQMGLPMLVPAPKVPIQKMPASRPASVPSSTSSHQSSQHPANIQPSGPPAKARKRAKQAAGAGTVLLALFSFVVFLGPIGPMAGPSLNALGRSHAPLGPATQMVLPGPGSLMDHPSGGGRVLMSVDGENVTDALPVSNETQLVLPINASFSGQAISLAEGSGDNGVLLEVLQDDGGVVQSGAAGQGWWSGLLDAAHVEPSRSIVLRPSNREAESQALQGLKDLAPLVLYSHWDQGLSQARLPSGQSPWQKSLPGTDKDESSGLNGFHSPSMCKEIFQFEAQETSVVQATQHVQRYLAGGTSSMRGSGSIALPPVTQPSQDIPSSRSSKRHKATIGCGEDDPDVVVSVMLPTKSQGATDNEFTSLDQLYVVVLTPGVKYSTYSCLLPKPVLV